MKQKIEISNYYSDDGAKKATVFMQDRGYGVDFFVNEEYDHSCLFTSKSLQYVEDAAENFVLGINKNYRIFKEV